MILDTLRVGCAKVSAQARHVSILEDRIIPFAESLPREPYPDVLDERFHHHGDLDSALAFLLALESVNFGSGLKYDLIREGYSFQHGSIYYTVAAALKKRFQDCPLTPEEMAAISIEDIAAIFSFKLDKPAQTRLAGMFCESMQELGAFIAGQGGFTHFIAARKGDPEHLIAALKNLSAFRDVHSYLGAELPFMKRAQHLCASLQLLYEQHGQRLFDDLSSLTLFADPSVPKVLAVDGVLRYTPELELRIHGGQEIESGSDEEIEIRACALHALELIKGHSPLESYQIDHILWHKSHEPRYADQPSHKTVTSFY